MLRVGLTGGIASGKSLVADGAGGARCGGDRRRRARPRGGRARHSRRSPRSSSGSEPDVLTDGRLDRRGLGEIVFADPVARRDLERIVHPAVRARAAELERAADGRRRRRPRHPAAGGDRSTARLRRRGRGRRRSGNPARAAAASATGSAGRGCRGPDRGPGHSRGSQARRR